MKKMTRKEYVENYKPKIKYSVGGSDAAILMGYGWTPIFTRFLQKLGDVERPDSSEAMEIGLEIEDTIDRIFQKRTGIKTRKADDIWVSEKISFVVGAIDRVSDKHIIEYKNASEYMRDEWKEGYPMSAYCQLQLYLWIDGNKRTGYIAGLIGGNKFVCSEEIEPDIELQNKIIERANEFHKNLINRNYEGVEISDKDSDAIKEKYNKELDNDIIFPKEDLLEKEIGLKEQMSELKKERKRIKNKIRWLLEDNAYAHTDNYEITHKFRTSNRFDSRTFKNEHPDLYKKYLKQSKYKTLLVKRNK